MSTGGRPGVALPPLTASGVGASPIASPVLWAVVWSDSLARAAAGSGPSSSSTVVVMSSFVVNCTVGLRSWLTAVLADLCDPTGCLDCASNIRSPALSGPPVGPSVACWARASASVPRAFSPAEGT